MTTLFRLIPALLLTAWIAADDSQPRRELPLLDGWRTTASEESDAYGPEFAAPDFDDSAWKVVSVPHNHDGYEGYRQAKHGVFHGSAWYRNAFTLGPEDAGRQVFLFFEGVGSYASVWVNGEFIAHHEGGLTTFTLDVTHAVEFGGQENVVAVRADHPAHIRDLPWVCGGCELAYGFSEGTQPFGISRPVTLVVTDSLRVAPFGVHAWNDQDISAERAMVHLTTEVVNHAERLRRFTIRNRLVDADGAVVATVADETFLRPGASTVLRQDFPEIRSPRLWSPAHPHLYSVVTEIIEHGAVVDRTSTRYGIRWVEWPDLDGPIDRPLKVNGEPVFVNGVADYEHLMGQSHAFSDAQVDARVGQILAAGFNAFRDAHHPHNLRFNEHWDREGVLWWTQFGAHIWFPREDFFRTYKARLADFVKERRNSPSVFMYGLQNESKLPEWFARECVELIRQLDPTASIQRPVVTCNGGRGTDWDVPQNWSGTYGGDPQKYADELRQQRMVGEYGAWRSLDLHSEGGFIYDGPLSEDRMTALMETKVRLAETVRERVIGHFMWPFTTHQNPGRNVGSNGEQTADGIRPLDQIGPANNKGLLTIWGEPLDAWYMYRSNYADPRSEPMVYIVSHTWPDRWTSPGRKDGIIVYSNTEEVELFNDYGGRSLGVRQRGATGTHFRWDDVAVETNLLYAEGRVGGQVVARDWITLHHLPEAPGLAGLDPDPANLTAPADGYTYLYRVNAGGPDYTDANGQVWQADRVYQDGDSWGSRSWASRFPNLDPRFGSKRRIFDPVLGAGDDALFQSFRYGRDELSYVFEVPEGEYRVELFFIEPWYGTGGGVDATGWRLFDVAINGTTVIENLDLFAEAGRATAVKKTVNARSRDGRIEVHFPRVASYQAVISAIAIASADETDVPPPPPALIAGLESPVDGFQAHTWLDTGVRVYSDSAHTLSALAWELREADWIQAPLAASTRQDSELLTFEVTADANIYVAVDPSAGMPDWLGEWEVTPFTLASTAAPDRPFPIRRLRVDAGERVRLGPNGTDAPDAAMYVVLADRRFPPGPAQSIVHFEIAGSQRTDGWRPAGNFRAGRPLHSDGGPAISRFHSRLSDADWIQTPQADAANPDIEVSLAVNDHAELYVALDRRVEAVPDWMADWIPAHDFTLATTDADSPGYRMWKRRLLPGQPAHLGPNARLPDGQPAPMYTAIIRAVREAFYLEIEDQRNAQGLVATQVDGFSGAGYVDLGAEGAPDSFALLFEVGVGDRYGLNLRYRSGADVPLRFRRTIRSLADGHVICSDEVTFAPTPGTDWAIQRTRTCNSVNAGVYAVELEGPGLHHLLVDQLEVE